MSALSSPTLDDFVGMDANTGYRISGEAHLRQSLRDILTTPLGTRVMRRGYGSRNFDLIDAPQGPGLTADIVAAAADGIIANETRVVLTRVAINAVSAGAETIDLELDDNGTPLKLEGVA